MARKISMRRYPFPWERSQGTIVLVTTGGTIACTVSPDGLKPNLRGEQLLNQLYKPVSMAEIIRDLNFLHPPVGINSFRKFASRISNILYSRIMGPPPLDFYVEDMAAIDSSQMTLDQRIGIVDTVRRLSQQNKFSVLVPHGSDTEIQTGLIGKHSLPYDVNMVLVSSQSPFGVPFTDAPRNFIDAILLTLFLQNREQREPGNVLMVSEGKALDPNRTIKIETQFAAWLMDSWTFDEGARTYLRLGRGEDPLSWTRRLAKNDKLYHLQKGFVTFGTSVYLIDGYGNVVPPAWPNQYDPMLLEPNIERGCISKTEFKERKSSPDYEFDFERVGVVDTTGPLMGSLDLSSKEILIAVSHGDGNLDGEWLRALSSLSNTGIVIVSDSGSTSPIYEPAIVAMRHNMVFGGTLTKLSAQYRAAKVMAYRKDVYEISRGHGVDPIKTALQLITGGAAQFPYKYGSLIEEQYCIHCDLLDQGAPSIRRAIDIAARSQKRRRDYGLSHSS